MPEQHDLVSQVTIKLNGADIQRDVMTKLATVEVDQHAHLPSMFCIRFYDPNLELLDNGPFDLTKEVEISAMNQNGQMVMLIKGEITALEPAFEEGMIAEFVVRGYDRSHRLFRELKSKAYVRVKDSELANRIASDSGLGAEVDATNTIHDHIYQHNQSDLEFLTQRAWRIGFECYVAEGKLHFHKPKKGGSSVNLTWGGNLLSFHPRITLAEQVDEVIVRGWNVENQTPIVGRAQSGNLYPDVGESKDGAGWAGKFGAGKLVIVDQPVINQAEADVLAAARLDEISGVFVEAEGIAFRCPEIIAGKTVGIEALGKRFSGKYLVTSATHSFTPEGLKTTFNVRGTRTGLLSEQFTYPEPLDRWSGVVTALVTNTDDPKDWGRVKLKYPWMSEDVESDWARVIGIGAGPEAGLYVIPGVGDEVLVVFEHGDFNHPYVLGGLWNGMNALPPEAASAAAGDQPLVRTWHSRNGHVIAMYDTDAKKIEIVSTDGRSIIIDDKSKKITIKTSSVEMTVEDSKLTIEAGSDVSIKANGSLKIEASGNLDIKAGGQVTVKGAMINLN